MSGADDRRARGRGQQIDHVGLHHVAQGEGYAPVQIQGTGRGRDAGRRQHRGAGSVQFDP